MNIHSNDIRSNLFNLPTKLTLIRLVISPLMLPFLLVYGLSYNILLFNCLLASLFLLIAITDFFDGFFARRYNQESLFGALLDPIADKFLIYSVLVALLAAGKIYFYWVLLLIGRELLVMGLRLIAVEHGFSVPVSWWGKSKTFLQIVLLAYLIINPCQAVAVDGVSWWNFVEQLLLGATLFISMYSAYLYYGSFMHKYSEYLSAQLHQDDMYDAD